MDAFRCGYRPCMLYRRKNRGRIPGFFAQWHKEYPGKNRYDDYFAALFEESRRKFPHVQNQGGSFLSWQLPRTGHHVIMFASGMGDGIYSAYWGLDSDGEVTELIMPFMNPEFF